MFLVHEVVRLKKDLPSSNLKAGTLGAIVMVYPESPQAYEVEFVDSDGDTLAILTLKEEDIVPDVAAKFHT